MKKRTKSVKSYTLGRGINKSGSLIVQIIIRDSNGSKLDFFTFNLIDKNRQKDIESILEAKYDIRLGLKDKEIFDF